MLKTIFTEKILLLLGSLSIITFIGSILLIPYLIIRIPTNYFDRKKQFQIPEYSRHPVVHIVSLLLKNFAGILFIIAGVVMLFIPGQGLLMIFIGLTLINFPGKRRLEYNIIRKPSILRIINRVRKKAKRPPLRFDP